MAFKLSPQQVAVNSWVLQGSGSLKLVARAGCGKTSTLMVVTDTIIKNNLGDIAIMAYNKSIAVEIQEKLKAAKYDWKAVQAGTVHSFGFSAWRKVAPDVKVDSKKVLDIIDSLKFGDKGDIYAKCSGAISRLVGYGKQKAIGHISPIDDNKVWYELWDHFDLDSDLTDDFQAEDVIQATKNVYRISLNMCREIVDFDDMILAPLYFKARFWPKKWIMVDETQDTNEARRALALAMLAPKVGRMIFVGDDRQAIYGFTGADSTAMDKLAELTKATTLGLTVTYRCPKAIVAEANTIVPDIVAADTAPDGLIRDIEYKDLFTEKLDKSDVILCRNTEPLVSLAFSFLAKGIVCKVEGREIGSGLIKLAKRWKVTTLAALLNKLQDYEAKQTARLMSKGQEDKVAGLVDQLECLRVIITRCQGMNKQNVVDLVSEIESMFGDTPDGEKPKVLTLSTVHKSKGREWPRVFILGRREYMPSRYARKPWQLLQEANLEYVAITRAQAELINVSM